VAVPLILGFLVIPILEIYLIIQVGEVIGGWQTLALLIVESLVGGWVVRREGRRTWSALRAAFGSGRVPDRELADGALVLIGGTLLLTPGFLTDVVGFFLVLPLTRPVARRLLLRWLGRRARIGAMGAFESSARRRAGAGPFVGGTVVDGTVVEGTVLHEKNDDEPRP